MARLDVHIAERYREWGSVPHVVREVYLDPSATGVAAALEGFCERCLGARVERSVLFEASGGRPI